MIDNPLPDHEGILRVRIIQLEQELKEITTKYDLLKQSIGSCLYDAYTSPETKILKIDELLKD